MFSTTKILKLGVGTSLAIGLAACGGGGSDGGNTGSASITLNGQVTDSAVSGAQVCLFSNGIQAQDAVGAAICSSATDANGNYSLTIPKNLASGFLTLVATKAGGIKLASTLGTSDQVLAAAGNGGTLTPSNLPAARVTHFTTADFALADTNNDGTVSTAELGAYVPDFAAVQKAATAIKAVIDFGQTSLIGGQTTNTLALASAAGRNQALGSTGQTADQWFADPVNANVIAAVNQDLVTDLNGKFTKYQSVQTATAATIPTTVTTSFNGVGASLYCEINTQGTVENETVDIAFDARRRVAVLQYTGDDGQPVQIVGSYNPQTGALNLSDYTPKTVDQSGNGVTFYHEGFSKLVGVVDASGNITGTFNGMSANTWTIDATRQECTNSGTWAAAKL